MTYSILLIEDDPGSAELVHEIIEGHPECQLLQASNSREALSILHKPEKKINLILLDLNLPGFHGRELLTLIKQDLNLRMIPVIILSTSENAEDIYYAYTQGASCYLTKPLDFKSFEKMLNSLLNFWVVFTQSAPTIKPYRFSV